MRKNLIFDLDDTILTCSKYYEQCKDDFVEMSVNRTGLQAKVIEEILNGVDLACMSLDDGFGKERFPRSFAATSAVLDIIRGRTPDVYAGEKAFDLGDSVFWQDYPIIEGAAEVLQSYKDKGYNLFLYTKGDGAVQHRKVHINDLDRFFDDDKIYVVGKKDGEQVQRILDDHKLNKDETVLIGDSIRDDIRSAVEAGIESVHVWAVGRRPWNYNETDQHFRPNHTVTGIDMLPHVLREDTYIITTQGA